MHAYSLFVLRRRDVLHSALLTRVNSTHQVRVSSQEEPLRQLSRRSWHVLQSPRGLRVHHHLLFLLLLPHAKLLLQ